MNNQEPLAGPLLLEAAPGQPWRRGTGHPDSPSFTAKANAGSFNALSDAYWCGSKGFEPAAEPPIRRTPTQRLDFLLDHVAFSTDKLAKHDNRTLVALPKHDSHDSDSWPRTGRNAGPDLPLPVLIHVRCQQDSEVIVAANPTKGGQARNAIGLEELAEGMPLRPEDLALSRRPMPLEVWALALDLHARIDESQIEVRSTAGLGLTPLQQPSHLGSSTHPTDSWTPVGSLDEALQRLVLRHVFPQVSLQGDP